MPDLPPPSPPTLGHQIIRRAPGRGWPTAVCFWPVKVALRGSCRCRRRNGGLQVSLQGRPRRQRRGRQDLPRTQIHPGLLCSVFSLGTFCLVVFSPFFFSSVGLELERRVQVVVRVIVYVAWMVVARLLHGRSVRDVVTVNLRRCDAIVWMDDGLLD